MNSDLPNPQKAQAHQAEAKARWGDTTAYREYEQKSARRKGDDADAAKGLTAQFSKLGTLKQLSPDDEVVQERISALQTFISDHYYTCTKDILKGLGEMYVADERFRENIDSMGGDGTAQFVSRAIAVYCAGE